MTVTYELQPHDMKSFASFTRSHLPSLKRMRYLNWFLLAVLSFTIALTDNYGGTFGRVVAFCLVFGVMLALSRAFQWLALKVGHWRSFTPEQQQGVLCQHTITLADDALIEVTPVNEGRHLWSGIHHVVETSDYIYVFITANAAHIVPKRAFGDATVARQFYERATRLCAEAKGATCLKTHLASVR